MSELSLVPGTLPAGWCPTPGAGALQEIYEQFFALGYASLPAGSGFSIKVSECTSPPSADEQLTVVWVPVDGSGCPLGIFKYAEGYWCWPAYQDSNSSSERRMFAGAEADVWAYDGGDGTNPATSVPTDYTGAMWEVDHTFDFRFPIGPGTSAEGTVVAVDATGGVETHALTEAELPEHPHYIASPTEQGDSVTGNELTAGKTLVKASNDPGGDREYFLCADTDATKKATVGDTSVVGEGDAHTNMPPYKGIFIIKRTARKFYTAPC